MTAPIVNAIAKCCGKEPPKAATCSLVALDAAATITCLVLGILGATATVGWLTPAASYALIGVSCGIVAVWLVQCVADKCCGQNTPQPRRGGHEIVA